MFSIEKYHEITPCIRGKELLIEILGTTGISKLWLNPDHVFVSTNGGSDLYAFDVVPQLRWRRAHQTKPNDCLLNPDHEPTIEVVWNKSEPSFIYVISETGTTSFWEFLKPSHEWIKHKSFQLSNAKGIRIVDVKLHEESRNIVWCERRGLNDEAFCVCCRNIIGNYNEKAKGELGTTQAILHNCPPINIFCFNGGVCIHPCQLYLEKVYVFWTGKKDVEGVVFKDGKVEESVLCSLDFRDIATALVGCWSKNAEELSLSCIGIAVHPSSQDLLILNSNGVLSKLCVKLDLVKLAPVCNIELPSTISNQRNMREIEVFTNGLIFGLIHGSRVMYLYDIHSGKLLQKIENFAQSSERLHLLTSSCVEPTMVFWNVKGFWKLKCPSMNELVRTMNSSQSAEDQGTPAKDLTIDDAPTAVSMTRNLLDFSLKVNETSSQKSYGETAVSSKAFGVIEIVVWLSAYGLEHSAFVVILDHIVSCLEARMEIPKEPLHVLRKLAKKVLQNPIVLLALGDKHLSLRENSLNELKQFLEELDQASVPSTYITPLNMQVLPFVRELFNVLTQQREVPSVELSKLSKVQDESTVADVHTALQFVTHGTPDAVSLDKLETLSLQEPYHAAKAFVPVNGENFQMESETAIGKVNAVLRAELRDRKWKRRRSPENAIILGVLFQLLYIDHPELLVDVIEAAKKSIADGASKDEATLQDLQECIRDFTLEFLPSAWSKKECDLKRMRIHSDILVRLGLERDALELFLQRQLWQEAVDLYVALSHRSANLLFTSQLYEMLLIGVLRGSGTSQRALLMKVFELKPQIIEISNLFELCLRYVPPDYAGSVLDEGNLTIGQARSALGQLLPKT